MARSVVITGWLLLAGSLNSANLGDYLYRQGAYFEAATEYQRQWYFGQYDSEDQLLYRLAQAYHAGGQISQAAAVLIQAVSNDETSPYDRDNLIFLTRINWEAYDYEQMRRTLALLQPAVTSEQAQQLIYIQAWSYIYQGHWAEGSEHLNACKLEYAQNLAQDIERIGDVPQKSVALATGMSRLLPGLGELYTGDLRNGLNAFVLVNAIRCSIIWDLYGGAYLLAAVKYFFLHTRYANGALRNLEYHVESRNVDALGNFLKTLSDSYPKPLELLKDMSTTE
ncbi:MAG: hypothetical protein JSU77_10475 [Fidelibacterota bacterium]|nr:MAG: hypothetical protein JSU77_10475 [Candidatus Neomarinimicrobiota bacterium]